MARRARLGVLFGLVISTVAVIGLLTPTFITAAEVRTRVRLRLILVLKDQTLRPIPRHVVEIVAASDGSIPHPEAVRITTGFDGMAETLLGPGTYHVLVQDPVELEGRSFT